MQKGQFQKGHKGYWLGKTMSLEIKNRMSNSQKTRYANGAVSYLKGKEPWNKGIKSGVAPRSAFKKGQVAWNKLNRTPEELREIKRQYRKSNPAQFKAYDHNKRMARKDLTSKTIQLVYEDNIKRFGTLTCYLCLKPIKFGKDHLEHKIPLSRGGGNDISNLDVACQHCNCSKHTKTVEEFSNAGIR